MRSAEIRESFLSFFEAKGCTRRPSSSLVPEDPSLLLTTAGMVQFKPVFLGLKDLGYKRATTVQKCVRTTDIDIIGTTGRHHSFFEMLGNFSFGDYFKREAIAWSWEYSTDVLGLDPDRIWASIFEEDDESEELWLEETAVPKDRIVRMGAKDNFWSAGPTGPCGPCSELYYDQGPEVGCGSPDCAPGCDCDRFVEYWNLVFMQYDRQEDGSLLPLPSKNIDTGMGLERLAAILQGVTSNFETDVLRQIMTVAEELVGVEYGDGERQDTSLRILADHARAVTFLIADGVLPSNESRGYVLRRLLRRAVRHGRLLGRTEPFMSALVDVVVEQMGDAYPEIVDHHELVRRIVDSEEQRFGATLRQGLAFLEEEVAALSGAGDEAFDGTKAFTLHDTYGFPIELTAEILGEHGLEVDMDKFESEMEAQRERARAAIKDESWTGFGAAFAELLAAVGESEFVGYEEDLSEAVVAGIVVDGERVQRLEPGQRAEIVLDRTPFYGEQGGQVGDVGTITSGDGAIFQVQDTQLPVEGIVAHIGELQTGALSEGEHVVAAIDTMRRERTRRNHTATHLLHWALRLVLGEHVRQGGSLVAPDRMRFDFTHFEAMSEEQVAKVERMVNAKIMENHPVRAYETSLRSAKESGVTALFGEKYGEFVRVLEVGNFSKELCGGTHVGRTSEINLLKITGEASVGANLRRIEALTSFDAYDYLLKEETELLAAASALKVSPFDVSERAAASARRIKELEDSARRGKATIGEDEISRMMETAADVGFPAIFADLGEGDAAMLRDASDTLRRRMGGGAVVLAVRTEDGGAILVAAGSSDAIDKGFDAGGLVKQIAPLVDGRGGGKRGMAQAGGKDGARIPDALAEARRILGAD